MNGQDGKLANMVEIKDTLILYNLNMLQVFYFLRNTIFITGKYILNLEQVHIVTLIKPVLVQKESVELKQGLPKSGNPDSYPPN